MIRIAICDDIQIWNDIIYKHIKDRICKDCQVEINVYQSGEELLSTDLKSIDAVFLDIDMPGISGIETAESLRAYNDSINIIFVTNRDDLVFAALKYRPFRFIRKRTFTEEIEEAIVELLKQINSSKDFIEIIIEGLMTRIKIIDIIYFETNGKLIKLICSEGAYEFKEKMEDLEKKEELKYFIRTHRCYLVNPRFIFAINRDEIELENNIRVLSSRRKKEEIKKKYQEYLRYVR